jgi:hypothetical protein
MTWAKILLFAAVSQVSRRISPIQGKPRRPLFAPDVDPALHTGITAEVAVLRDLLNASPGDLYKVTHQQSYSGQ